MSDLFKGHDVSDPTTYNRNKQKEAMDARVAEIAKNIAEMERMGRTLPHTVGVISAMDFIEKCLVACGGEPKVQFLEASSMPNGGFIRILSRVPLTANIFPFKPEGEDNPRYHKVVTKLLLQQKFVSGVKWVPNDSGAVLMVELTKGE